MKILIAQKLEFDSFLHVLPLFYSNLSGLSMSMSRLTYLPPNSTYFMLIYIP